MVKPPKLLIPIGTDVEYFDRRSDVWRNGRVHGYDIGRTKYHLCVEAGGGILEVPTTWAFLSEVRLRSEDRIMPFKVDEEVTILIEGSFIQAVDEDSITINVGCEEVQIPLGEAGVTITRVQPAEWPPQVGDLWEDSEGIRWFAMRYSKGDIVMHPDGGGDAGWLVYERTPADFLSDRADVRLLSRRASAS